MTITTVMVINNNHFSLLLAAKTQVSFIPGSLFVEGNISSPMCTYDTLGKYFSLNSPAKP